MTDWLPKPSRIDDPVADDTWTYRTPQGVHRSSRVTIGRPAAIPGDPNGDWYCPLYFEHVTPEILCAVGVGPVDALMNAMRFVWDRFQEFSDVRPRSLPAPGTAP
ncbi:hypothetical protein P2318_00050 [Myxococcaceae bacterium GXIMD 01537]